MQFATRARASGGTAAAVTMTFVLSALSCQLSSAQAEAFEEFSKDIRGILMQKWYQERGTEDVGERLDEVANIMQMTLTGLYGVNLENPSKRKRRAFSVMVWKSHACSLFVGRDTGCDVEVPSDTCADSADRRVIRNVEVATDMMLDTAVFWYPRWHTSARILEVNHFLDHVAAFRADIVQECVNVALQRWGALQGLGRIVYRSFESCIQQMADRLDIFNEEQGYAQVIGLGQEFHAKLSAPAGGLVFEMTPYGHVVLLPLIRH